MNIPMDLLKKLRDETGAGMLDCKKALAEVALDLEEAKKWLREKGIAKASRKTERLAGDGAIGVLAQGPRGVILEVNSETDFVARTQEFQDLVQSLLELAAKDKIASLDQLLETSIDGGTVQQKALELAGKVGENVVVRRLESIEVPSGIVASYVHSPLSPSLGRIGVLVGLQSEAEEGALQEIGRNLAMHVAASRPEYIRRSEVPQEKIDQERSIIAEQISLSEGGGKPQAIIEKMVEGRLRKFFEEIALEEQEFIREPGKKVIDFLKEEEKKVGHAILITHMTRFILGE